MEENEILSTKEVMAKLKLSYRTVLSLIAQGSLPAAKVARRYRVQSSDLMAMLNEAKATRKKE